MSAADRPSETTGKAPGTTRRTWRYDTGSATPDPYPSHLAAFEAMLDTAWRELLFEHMPFGVVSADERERLLRSLRDVERIFSEATDARELDYYQEVNFGAEPKAETLSMTKLRHVVLMQAQLMEQAYFALTLSRSANAPSNRGWINLFRRWAGSGRSTNGSIATASCSARQFVAFYDNYLRFYNRTIDVAPVPHPWDAQIRSRRMRRLRPTRNSGNASRSGGRPGCPCQRDHGGFPESFSIQGSSRCRSMR